LIEVGDKEVCFKQPFIKKNKTVAAKVSFDNAWFLGLLMLKDVLTWV
jgi:hypothetical protein